MHTKTPRYIPTANGIPYTQYKPEIGDYPANMFEAYVSGPVSNPANSKISYYAIFYIGRQSHSVWHYRFDSLDDIKAKINGAISALMAREDAKAKRKVVRNAPSALKLGDILYSSWGYDQTNIDFYQVTRLVGAHTVEIRAIQSSVDHGDQGSDYVKAIKDAFTNDKPLIKRVRDNTTINLNSYASAWLWDGKPKYQTATGWGH